MRDSPIGLQAGVDPRRWARVLSRAHAIALGSGYVPTIVRRVIADSWERCTETGVDPGAADPPLLVASDDAGERWREHPLSRTTDVLHSVLGGLLYDARHIVVVSDADGCLLWSDGHPDVLRASERIRFTPGHGWSERAAGTNAVGTALAADRPVQVFSAEHYRSAVHGWQCSGAPIHDPDTGALLGAIDITGRWETASEHTLALVQAAARLVEERLRADMHERDGRILKLFAEYTERHGAYTSAAALAPSGRVLTTTERWRSVIGAARIDCPPAATDVLLTEGVEAGLHPLGEGLLAIAEVSGTPRQTPYRLKLRGRSRACFSTPTAEHRLTERQTQIIEVLTRHREGLNAHDLSALVYGEPGHEVALRAELHRLREVLGPALVARPYRLEGVALDLDTAESP